jgi:hypothetical protein
VHTLKVITAGFSLLGVFLLAGRFVLGGNSFAMANAARFFIPVWLALAGVNMWFGVSKAGYSVREEAPVLLVVFAIPAAAAMFIAWRYRAH